MEPVSIGLLFGMFFTFGVGIFCFGVGIGRMAARRRQPQRQPNREVVRNDNQLEIVFSEQSTEIVRRFARQAECEVHEVLPMMISLWMTVVHITRQSKFNTAEAHIKVYDRRVTVPLRYSLYQAFISEKEGNDQEAPEIQDTSRAARLQDRTFHEEGDDSL
jgi:hypothetical protein